MSYVLAFGFLALAFYIVYTNNKAWNEARKDFNKAWDDFPRIK